MVEEGIGGEPTTNRDYLILLWDGQKELKTQMQEMNGFAQKCEDRFDKVERRQDELAERQSTLTKIEVAFTTLAAIIAAAIGINVKK